MDEYRRKLEEQAEESEFALMFDDYMMDLGEALQNEFEAADSRGEVPDMPEDMKQRLRQFVATYGSSDNNIGVKEQDTVAQPVKSRRQTHKWLRRMGVAAASIAVMFAAMVTVQAAGVDVFGAIGRWTDSVFHFEGENKETIIQSPNESIAEKLKNELLTQGIPQKYTPSWLPETARIIELKVNTNDASHCVKAMCAVDPNDWLIIEIRIEGAANETSWKEKGEDNVEIYIINDMQFYVFSNNDTWTAAWSNGVDSISIYTSMEKANLIRIIESMEGE